MTINISGVLAGVAALLAASSASASPLTSDGHYEWRAGVQAPGPRSPVAGPRRVWVSPTPARSGAEGSNGTMAAAAQVDTMSCCKLHSA